MDFVSRGVFVRARQRSQDDCRSAGRALRQKGTGRLRALAAVMLMLFTTMPSQAFAQDKAAAPTQPKEKSASNLPQAPQPEPTSPLYLRPSMRNFSEPFVPWYGNPIRRYLPTDIAKSDFANPVKLTDLVKDGKIYLSLSDALALALEDNYDIAIARYNLDIADTDILRTRNGSTPLGAPSGLVTGTLGGSVSTLSTGGGPGGTTVGSGGAGSGAQGLALTTAGAGPAPENLEPTLGSTVQFERAFQPQVNTLFSGGKRVLNTNTNTYDFTFNKGFITGTSLTASLNNLRITTDAPFTVYSPELSSVFKATVTQHLLQGAGIWVNKRYMYQALNDRRITDAGFRQQILYTVNQVENIYWGLVQDYEDVQAKQRAVDQSSQLLSDDRRQLQVGTMAPLDVVNAESEVASDKQALISAENALNYQQQIMKQAIARNLNDPVLSEAPVIPTDRVSLQVIPEESEPVEALVQEAFKQRPELEQAVLTLRNDEITLRGARNALLPTLDVYGFYGSSALGGAQGPNCLTGSFTGGGGLGPCPPGTFPTVGYGTVAGHLFNSSAPDKGMGFTLSVPLTNRTAQATQARSLMEYRQAELRLEQLYTQIRMQVVNQKYALTNDRAAVQAAQATANYDQQSLDDEIKKLHLGASTEANVMQQQRNLATAEDNLIVAHGQYAKDRALLYQVLATTLHEYGINLNEAATGNISAAPLVPGVQPAPPGNEPSMQTPPTPNTPVTPNATPNPNETPSPNPNVAPPENPNGAPPANPNAPPANPDAPPQPQ
jgi:outer membrane protein